MIAGPPNGGKSLLALWYAVRNNLPTLYVSADTDQATTVYRSLAMITGDKVDNIEGAFEVGAEDQYTDSLAAIDNVRFSFDPTPTLDDIAEEVEAYQEVWGRPPELIIIDNLMNIFGGGDNSWSSMMETSQFLHHLARKAEAAVWILHHTTESEGKPYQPAARRAIINKVSQLPEVILTVSLEPQAGRYHVACVKNRSGPHDATGGNYVSLYAVPSRMQLYDNQADMAMAQTRNEYT